MVKRLLNWPESLMPAGERANSSHSAKSANLLRGSGETRQKKRMLGHHCLTPPRRLNQISNIFSHRQRIGI